jgi:predicted ATPase
VAATVIRTPDQRLRVFVSSTLVELADERRAAKLAIERLRLSPVMFELGARPHPPRALYRSYLAQSHIFIGVYWQRYGWVAPGEQRSGLEDEYRLAGDRPRLLYVKEPAPEREERLGALLREIQELGAASYRVFATADELGELVAQDLALLLTERFEASVVGPQPRPASNLPHPVTPTFGRDREVLAVADALGQGVRLITLVGPGGIGKTRLALDAARRVEDGFEDGVVFVPLAAVTDAALVIPTILDRFGRHAEGAQQPLDVLADALRQRQVLLVLDNLEQVSSSGSDLVALLERCPGLQIVATSRHALRVRGEQLMSVDPLPVPPPGTPPEAITDAAAVQLFVDRARAFRPDFTPTAAEADAVAELCRRLDGLPLAIELAAAQVRLVPPTTLLERLGDRLDSLSGGADLPPRQRTLRATIEWSLGLLTAAERDLLCQMSVFAGGADLDAIEAVCTVPAAAPLLEHLAALIDKSLITNGEQATTAPRFRMLETIRQHVLEQLEARGEAEAARDRHLAHYAALGQVAQPRLCGPGQREWAERLDPDRPNLRAAMATALARGRRAVALQLVWDTIVYFYIRDAFDEPRRWLEAIRSSPEPLSALEQVHLDVALAIAGVDDVATRTGRLESAIRHYREHGIVFERAVAHHQLGIARWESGAAEAAISELEAASAGYRSIDHDWGVAIVETTLGAVQAALGDRELAVEHHERSLSHARLIDNRPLTAQALQQLALLASLAGETADARRWLDEARHLVEEDRSVTGASYCLEAAAALALSEGDAAGCTRMLASAQAARDRIGVPGWTAAEHTAQAVAARARAELGAQSFSMLWAAGETVDPFMLLRSEAGAAT